MINSISRKGKREAKAKNTKKILLVFSPVKEVENAIIHSDSNFFCAEWRLVCLNTSGFAFSWGRAQKPKTNMILSPCKPYLGNFKTPSFIVSYSSTEINF